MSSRGLRLAALLPAVLLASGGAGCGKPPAETWPPGTVLAVDRIPITEAEVDQVAGWIALVQPSATPLHLRRLALANSIFPRCAARTLARARWDEMREIAEERRALLEEGAPGPPGAGAVVEVSGGWSDLGLEVFGAALEAGPGRWSQVVESAGAFHLVRLVETSRDDPHRVTVSRIDLPYLGADGSDEIERALDSAKLTIVDPSWREAVPLSWIHRMKGGRS